MKRSPSRLLFFGFMVLFLVIMVGSYATYVDAQSFPDDYIHDDRLYVYAALDGNNLKDYDIDNPITINMDANMTLDLQIDATGTENLNMSGTITFWYQGIALFPIQIIDEVTESIWVIVDPSLSIQNMTASLDFSQMMTVFEPINLATGIFEATVDFRYYILGDTTLHIVQHTFSFLIPADPYNVITSVTGISAIVATFGAVTGVGQSIWSLWDGLKTAYKLRGIHKKASEIRSLPNLTVLSSLPLLFSMLDAMKKKKKEGREDSGVSEYIVRQRLREVAPDAWPGEKCPNCKRNWNKKLDMCKKCNFTREDARTEYANVLAEKVPAAIRWMGKKKASDVKTLAKKTKSTQYNAGVIAAAMVDTEVTEITKVGTPLRSFVFNVAGLAFLVITWQQLLGDSSSQWQTSITLIGAAMSLALIIALYVNRKAQIEKFVADQEDGKKMLPTEEEAAAEAEAESKETEDADEAEVEEVEEPEYEDEPTDIQETTEPDEDSDEETDFSDDEEYSEDE
ncbi:MAG: hypothetical protein ACFFF9_12930 [Candidatus Thorarchaeota archaeon]